jgi:hydroxymethylbilane synthase
MGAVVGTAALRRQALVKHLRRDLSVAPLRGNVETRLKKLDDGEVDAIILALAGLKRLGREAAVTAVLEPAQFLPAAGQGAIAIETRANDAASRDIAAAVDHAETREAVAAERTFLAVLEGSCRTPIAAHATITDSGFEFHGMILRPDGSEIHETTRRGSRREALQLAADAGRELRLRGGPGFFSPE